MHVRRVAGFQLPMVERVLSLEDSLAARDKLAYCTGETGDAAGVRVQLAVLLPVIERTLGPEHAITLATRRALAHWTAKARE